MNLILLEEADCPSDGRAWLRGRRLQHLRAVLRASVGDALRVGMIGGKLGLGRIVAIDAEQAELELQLDQPPPSASAVALALALPRPPALRRILQSAAAMGVKLVLIFDSHRVERSYWQSSSLAPAALRRQLLLGLEQGRDTILPEVRFCRRFRGLLRDELPVLLAERTGLVAHPEAAAPCPHALTSATALLVGPEGGLLPAELDGLLGAGMSAVGLGERPLRVETAVVALISRLTP